MEIFAKVEDSVLDITNRCFPDATALAVRLEDLDQTDQEEDFYSRVGSIHQLFIHYFLEKFGNKYIQSYHRSDGSFLPDHEDSFSNSWSHRL